MSEHHNDLATVRQILDLMNELAPPELAEKWDQIGLQTGSLDQVVTKVMLALDATSAVIRSAASGGFTLIISHHPLIFNPLTAICTHMPEQNLIYKLIQNSISLIVAHTNLDAATGGVADCLLDCLWPDLPGRQTLAGYGRLIDLAEPEPLALLPERVRRRLGSGGCRINLVHDRLVHRIAVFPGSFSEEWVALIAASGADTVICGEIKHHLGLQLAERGVAAIDAGHDVTERVVLQPLQKRLSARLPNVSFAVSGIIDYNGIAF
ncbi:MAG TPA: Nif3-like dinuclear metal center hexameric protein [Clostridiales bacterium]|nr:Nif3-like dinuclear metal center hexameric protein [Clostridiales bacterium]